jgi:hypothetical protein
MVDSESHNKASNICQERQDLFNEICSLKRDFQLSGCKKGFIDPVVNSTCTSRPNKNEKHLGFVYISRVEGVSEKFKRIGNRYNIRKIFNTQHNIRSSLMKTRPERDPLQTAQCIYSISCECGRNYTSETDRPLSVRLREHRHHLQQGLLEKSKLAQHAYEEGHRLGWDDARILDIERNSRYRKYKESAHMTCLTNPISQTTSDISPIWIPLVSNDITNSQKIFV